MNSGNNYCPNCGHRVRQHAKYCTSCGYAVPLKTQERQVGLSGNEKQRQDGKLVQHQVTFKVFVSYSRNDTWIVDQLLKRLADDGFDVWIDRGGIRVGDLWRYEIVQAIKEADIFLILLSPNSIESDQVRKELDIADNEGKQILPALFPGVTMPPKMEYQLAGVHYIELFPEFNNRPLA